MIRLVLFLLLVGVTLWGVGRVMGVLRGGSEELPPPDDDSRDEDDDEPR